jgi:ATPase subunit of ABC transporter with duplicated ATPase domains
MRLHAARMHAHRRQQQRQPSLETAATGTSPSTSSSPDYSVITQGLRVSLGQAKSQILNGVDFKVKRGSLHMLIGPNGCGKSTLLRTLGGLYPEFTGEVDIDGPSGFVFQNPDHQVVMPTVAADVAFGLGRSVHSMLDGHAWPCVPGGLVSMTHPASIPSPFLFSHPLWSPALLILL